MNQVRNPGKKYGQDNNDDGESTSGCLNHRLAKGFDAIAHRLNAGHRRATAGKGLLQQPNTWDSGNDWEVAESRDRHRMTSRRDGLHHSKRDGQKKDTRINK